MRGLAARRFALPGGSSEMAAFTSLGQGETNDIVARASGPLASSVQPAAQVIWLREGLSAPRRAPFAVARPNSLGEFKLRLGVSHDGDGRGKRRERGPSQK